MQSVAACGLPSRRLQQHSGRLKRACCTQCAAPSAHHRPAGYGNTGPQQCWAAAWVLAMQMIVAVLLEAIVIGIVFA